MRTSLCTYFNLGPEIQEKMSLKGFSYLELWRPLCSAEHNKISAIFKKVIMRNNSGKLFCICTSGSGDIL